ncbi:MAG: 23S rRNA (pseudouridine(1915)-N(3))-methyltransferase RlmH [Gemmatimonadota bacterium]
MKLIVVAVGGVRGPLEAGIREYLQRASRYWKLEVVEVDAGAPGRDPAPERVRREEGERITARIPADCEYWVLTREGRGLSSAEWARVLEDRALHGGRDLALVVGGAFGLDPDILRGARRRISLAHVTLPHELARLVLLEQLYRAGTILRNEPYHKGNP